MTQFSTSAECSVNLKYSAWLHRDLKPKHLVETVALLSHKLFKGFRHYVGVMLYKRTRISLEVSQASLASFERLKLVPGKLANLLKISEFRPQLVEGYRVSSPPTASCSRSFAAS